ncbi:MAG: hypothetical protein HC913_19905 [Microscillaceae bacterium]|nr:hypothetical protein [Microscillaceae bacterium]
MADVSFEDQEKIKEILKTYSRVHYLVTQEYGIPLEAVLSVRVDGENGKIDVNTADTMLRFKAKGSENALVSDPETGGMKMVFDPALAQAIFEIIQDYAPEA